MKFGFFSFKVILNFEKFRLFTHEQLDNQDVQDNMIFQQLKLRNFKANYKLKLMIF